MSPDCILSLYTKNNDKYINKCIIVLKKKNKYMILLYNKINSNI